MLEKRCRLMAAFGRDDRWARWGVTGARGWAYMAWAVENEASVFGNGRTRSGTGYVGLEVEKIVKRRKQNHG